jgi:capsular exopolysaccharide synthesis family protein
MARFTIVQEAREAPAESELGLVSPKKLLLILRRRAWPVGLTMIAVLILAAGAYFVADRQYVATGTIALDRQADPLVDTNPQAKPLTTDSPSVETEVQVIKSPSTAGAVVDALKLAKARGYGIAEDAPAGTAPSRDRAIRAVQHGLVADRSGTSYAISVGFAAADPALAASVVNSAMNAYTGGQKSSAAAQLSHDIGMLADRLKLVRVDLLKADKAVAQYRAGTGLIDLANNSDAANQAMESLNTQLAQARADEAAAQSKANSGDSLVGVTDSSTVSALRAQQSKLLAQKADLQQRYSDQFPALVRLNDQLNAVNQQLAAEEARVRAGVAAQAKVARDRAASLRNSVNREQGKLMSANAASVHLAELERNADSAKTLYASLLDQYKQKLAAQGTEQSKAYVIAYAAPPTAPASPKSLAYLIGGVLAAIIAGVVVALVLDNMENGLLNQSALEQKLRIPALAAIPDIRTVKDIPLKRPTPGRMAEYLLEHPTGAFAEAFRSLRTSLKLDEAGARGKSLAITSAVADEGKTATSICLAQSAALAGKRVLLIDCDLRHHACTDLFAPDPPTGLVEVLEGRTPLDQAVVKDVGSGLSVLPTTASAQRPIDLITSPAMRALLARLANSYDLVILETPPVLPVAEARALTAMADSTLLIARWRTTPAAAVKKAIGLLNRAGANITGAVLTRVSLSWTALGSLGDDVYYYRDYANEPRRGSAKAA